MSTSINEAKGRDQRQLVRGTTSARVWYMDNAYAISQMPKLLLFCNEWGSFYERGAALRVETISTYMYCQLASNQSSGLPGKKWQFTCRFMNHYLHCRYLVHALECQIHWCYTPPSRAQNPNSTSSKLISLITLTINPNYWVYCVFRGKYRLKICQREKHRHTRNSIWDLRHLTTPQCSLIPDNEDQC